MIYLDDMNIVFIFAVLYIYTGRVTASFLTADFLYPYVKLNRHSTPLWTLNGATAPCECRAKGQAVPSFISQPTNKLSVNALHRKHLFASEQQYLTSNASRSEIRARLNLRFFQIRKQSHSFLQKKCSAFFRCLKTYSSPRRPPHGKRRTLLRRSYRRLLQVYSQWQKVLNYYEYWLSINLMPYGKVKY